ncbi:MAG: serpin family protein [Bacteroidaceae bacterium]|nr:serpin family protein [Bacteroidaceae bacterium]
MKRLLLLTMCCLTALGCWAQEVSSKDAKDTKLRPMLVEGKKWYYARHRYDEEKGKYEYDYEVWYTLKGDTVIDGRQYKKMYRTDELTWKEVYFGAFREDEEGRVWHYDRYGDKQDAMACDVTLRSYPLFKDTDPTGDVVNVYGRLLHRYRWDHLVGVEGVGLQVYGIVRSPEDPEPDCLCDYESFEYVEGDVHFSAYNFDDPHYIDLTSDEKQWVAQSNDFSYRLFRKLRTEKSKVLSPLSVTYVLGMLNNGAAGQTQKEISEVLGFESVEAQNAFCQKMTDELATASLADNTTKTLFSNTIFVNRGMGFQLQKDFTDAANLYYNATPSARDFADGETLDVINQWSSDHTEGMIEKIINKEEFNPRAVSYLLNAIYFKGAWSTPFEVGNTQEESFNGGEKVPMMHKEYAELLYGENALCQSVVLPYGNGTYQMQVYLPRKGTSLEELLEHLSAKDWKLYLGSYMVDLKLPRFETETNEKLEQTMAYLGMPLAFDPGRADFSRLCVNDYEGNIYISMMKQVAKIKLDEQGTEAAAVTIIGTETTGIPEEATFHANRPFFYTISEQSTGLILFMGQYTDGTADCIVSPQAGKSSDNRLYDLTGRRLSLPPTRGIYIQGGRKRVVR